MECKPFSWNLPKNHVVAPAFFFHKEPAPTSTQRRNQVLTFSKILPCSDFSTFMFGEKNRSNGCNALALDIINFQIYMSHELIHKYNERWLFGAACAPVLLPDRVIQALNLNVHALGLHISPKDRHRKRFRSGHEDDIQDCLSPWNKINGSKVDEQCYIISENQTNSSPELFLPKEWTY